VVISDVQPGSPAEAAGVQIGDVLAGVDGKAVDNLPVLAFHFFSVETGDKVHLDLLRGKARFAFDVKVMEPPHDMDQIAALADPEKNLVPTLGILGLEIDRKSRRWRRICATRLEFWWRRGGRRGRGSAVECRDVIRTLNGQPMTTLDRLRGTLKGVACGSAGGVTDPAGPETAVPGFHTRPAIIESRNERH